MILTTALAVIASAVFVYQVMEPTSFLSAVRGVEVNAISREKWDDVYAELRGRLSTDSVAGRHEAVGHLLNLVIQVERGRQQPSVVLSSAQAALNVDADNLVARLAYAVLADAKKPPLDRFEAMRQVVERQPPAAGATLYNDEYTRVWHDVLTKYILRADVAASAANSLDHYQIVEHYAALPMMQQRVASLAHQLRAGGKATEADTCIRWFGRTMLGVMDSEKDAGTSLLCAELMARSSSPDSSIASDLIRFRNDFHQGTDSLPTDLTSLSRAPAIDGNKLRWMVKTLAIPAGIFFASIGSLVMLCGSTLGVLLLRFGGNSQLPSSGSNPASTWRGWVILLIGASCVGNLARAIASDGLYSPSWGITLLVTTAAIGAMFSILLVPTYPEFQSKLDRQFICVVLALAPSIIAIIPSQTWASFWRPLDISVGVLWIQPLIAALYVVIVLMIARPPSRLLAQAAAFSWCFFAILGLGLLQLHFMSDPKYQEGAIRSLDEIPARLGPDWQDQYLKSARAAYDVKP